MQEEMFYEERKSFRTDEKKKLMVLESRDNSALPYQINMLRYNDIEGILPMQFYIEDSKYKYFYDVTAMENLAAEMACKKYNSGIIRTILTNLYKTITQMENFLLDINCLILIPEYIFIKIPDRTCFFCYYPEKNATFQESLEQLAEYFINHISYEDDADVNLVYEIYRRIKTEKETLGEILEIFCNSDENPDDDEGEDEQSMPDIGKIFDGVLGNEENGKPGNGGNMVSAQLSMQNKQEKQHAFRGMISVVVDLIGASGVAAFVLYLMKRHSQMSRPDFVLWFAGTAAVLLGSSALSCYLSDRNKAERKYRNKDNDNQYADSLSEDHYENMERKNREEPEIFSEPGIVSEADEAEEIMREKNETKETKDQIIGSKSGTDIDIKADGDAFEEMSFCAESSCQDPIPKTVKINSRDEIPATVIMKSAEPEPLGELRSLLTGKSPDIEINEDEIIIGKVPGMVDICLEQDCVSRIHAIAGREDNRYFIEDEDSTNGTYVNGIRIKKQHKKYLKEGDIVRLADVEYQFQMKYPENDTQTIGIGV